MMPMGTIRRRDDCRFCGSTRLQLVLRHEPIPIADIYLPASRSETSSAVYPLDLFLCEDCGLAQLRDVLAPEILYRDYVHAPATPPGFGSYCLDYADWLKARAQVWAGALVVDVSKDDGELLRVLKRGGARVLRVPFLESARDTAGPDIETRRGRFDRELARAIRGERGPAALVMMNYCFGNDDDVDGPLEGARALLDAAGAFVLETTYFVDFIERLVFEFLYHEHLCYCTVGPLARFLAKHGMEIFDVERLPNKGGALRVAAQLVGGPRKISSRVKELIQYEERIGIHEPGPLFEGFQARVAGAKDALADILAREARSGGGLAGYGASATSTPLLYQLGLKDQLDFLVDENPAKQGTVSPGCHLPVHPPAALLERKPAATVILAWRYWEAIARKHKPYLEAGGKFILPLPEPKVIS